MKIRLLWVACGAFLLAIWLLNRASDPTHPGHGTPEASTPSEERSPPAVQPHSGVVPRADRESLLASVGVPTPMAVEPYLTRAVQTFKFIEQERRGFPEGSLERNMLESLARKLFIDDYRYAARATGVLEAQDAEVVYAQLKAEAVSVADGYEPLAAFSLPPGPAAELLVQAHARMMESPNPAYQHVWAIVQQHDPLAHQTDLWKDALLYAASHAMLNDWMREEIERLERHELPVLDDESFRRRMEQGLRDSIGAEVDHIRQVQASYQNVFSERFRARGVDPELVQALQDLEVDMTGVGGNDFEVP